MELHETYIINRAQILIVIQNKLTDTDTMGLFDILKKEVDKLTNPYEYETEKQTIERHRREDRQHELALEKIKHTRINKTEDDKGSFLNDWDNF